MGVRILNNFVVLGNWTEQGIKNIKDAPKRAKLVKEMVQKSGGEIETYYTIGKFDFVAFIKLPKEDDIMSIMLCLASMGNIRTTTMKAWTEEETTKMLTTPHP